MAADNITGGERPDAIGIPDDVRALLNLTVKGKKTYTGNQIPGTVIEAPDRFSLDKRANEIADQVTDSQEIKDMLPDIELAKQVVCSSIISPQDMISTDINFTVENEDLPAELITPMRTRLERFFTQDYRIAEFVPDAIEEALFGGGAYPLVTVPETGLDSLINHGGRVTLESIREELNEDMTPRNIGILGNGELPKDRQVSMQITMEAAFADIPKAIPALDQPFRGVTITDNLNVLKFPAVLEQASRQRVQNAYHQAGFSPRANLSRRRAASLEAKAVNQDKEYVRAIERELYRPRNVSGGLAMALSPVSRYSRAPKGHPLVMRLPMESILPVHIPGSPERHVGYFVLLDEYGNPLYRSKGSDYYRQFEDRLRSDKDLLSSINSTSYRQMFGNQEQVQSMTLDAKLKSYATIVENDFLNRLRSGAIQQDVEITSNNEFYRIMLARQLGNYNTQILYVPVDLTTYIAADYDDDGVGRSLLEKSKLISTMRSILMFANTMRAMRQAVGKTSLKIQLDPEDADPATTVEQMMHEFMRTRARAFPLHVNNAHDLVGFLQNAGIDIVVSGNPNYPETSMDQEERQMPHSEINTELEELLRRKHMQAFSLPPEIIDSASQIEFAESIVSGNLLFAKRIVLWQRCFAGHFNDHIRKFVYNSGALMEGLREDIREALKEVKEINLQKMREAFDLDEPEIKLSNEGMTEQLANQVLENKQKRAEQVEADEELVTEILFRFVDSFSIQFPSPDVDKFEQQAKALTKYSEGIEQGLRAHITDDMLQGLAEGSDAGSAAAVFNAIKSFYLREFMRRNNIMPELEALSGLVDESAGVDVVDSAGKHTQAIQRMLQKIARKTLKSSAKFQSDVDSDRQKIDEANGGGDAGYDAGGGYEEEDAGGGFGEEEEFDAGGGQEDAAGGGEQPVDEPEAKEEENPDDKEPKEDTAEE